MDRMQEETMEKVLNKVFSGDNELFESATRVLSALGDIAHILKDKYPKIEKNEVATIGIQLFWDACVFSHMKKEEIIALANKVLKEM